MISARLSVVLHPIGAAVLALFGAGAASGAFTVLHGAGTGVDLRTMQDYLGHRDPKHTVHYTRVAGRQFEGLWK